MTLEEYIKQNYHPDWKNAEQLEVQGAIAGCDKVGTFALSLDVAGMVAPDTSKYLRDKLFKEQKEKFVTLPIFADYLVEQMNNRDLSAPEVYKACNMTKATFSRILNPNNHPSKNSVLSLCIGLGLKKPEAVQFLARAGFAFNPADLRDVIVEYFIENEIYDIDIINGELDAYGEDILGGKVS